MYSRCLFCGADLGRNECIEAFPVGRRVAFDAARGRLWVICRACSRWNLTPLDERWEAVEACEQLYRTTPLRSSTDHIGLARLAEGLELVRVGRAPRPEFAAWRYGDQFGRRFRRMMLTSAAVGVTGPILFNVVGGSALLAVPVGVAVFQVLPSLLLGLRAHRRVLVRVPDEAGRDRIVRTRHVWKAALVSGTRPAEWTLRFEHDGGVDTISGETARFAAGRIMAAVNQAGATGGAVRAAVEHLERAGGPERLLETTARTSSGGTDVHGRRFAPTWARGPTDALVRLPEPARLAVEMALHEESEQRAMAGELAELESAWREAERIAAIADDLLIPAEIDERLARLKQP
jgi:hypothetical protein